MRDEAETIQDEEPRFHLSCFISHPFIGHTKNMKRAARLMKVSGWSFGLRPE
jgi:hypothetical protein